MPSNQAAWLTNKSAKTLEVKTAPYTQPGSNEIVIKNAAIAINPIDWLKLTGGSVVFGWIKYPFILGSDSAGEVVEVGPGVTRFKVGDRVLGHAIGTDPDVNKATEGSFQHYTIVRCNLASPIPDSLSYEEACVLPLGLSTAACGLFQKDFLALEYPSINPAPTGKTVLIWGGSTSVGSNAIQLASAAGYSVITTCSPKNFDYVKKLGASEAFDYRSLTVVQEIVAALKNQDFAGAFALGNGSLESCLEIAAAANGNKFVVQGSVTMPGGNEGLFGPSGMPSSMLGMIGMGMNMAWGNAKMDYKFKCKGVGKKFVSGSALFANEVGRKVYEDFLPEALARGKYVCAPEAEVVGHGLEKVQEGLELNMKGMSARKVVVTL